MHEIKKIEANKLTFDCRIAGNPNGELILFLHGFPETNYMWRNLMSHFAKLGFYCVAPNLRGVSSGATPSNKELYTFEYLVGDIIGISQHFSKSKFHLVGHDWGAAIGWQFVHDYPELILSWSALSFPHNQAFRNALLLDPDQKKRAQYSKLFTLRYFPEFTMTIFNNYILKKIWFNSDSEEVEDYLSVFSTKKHLNSFLNYYRANRSIYKKKGAWQDLGVIEVPTLFMWGKHDAFIGAHSAQNCGQFVNGDYTYIELHANHWLIQSHFNEVKNAVNQHILKYPIKHND